MECVEGRDPGEATRKRTVPLEQALKYGDEIADALALASRSKRLSENGNLRRDAAEEF